MVAATCAGCEEEIPPTDDGLDYVAIGDSYTAAPWIPEVSTDGCARSDHNYPHLVADRLDQAQLIDVSCGGATMDHVLGSQAVGGRVRPPQIDALSPDTDLVTVGLGVNDLGYNYTASIECLLLASESLSGSPCEDANAAKIPQLLQRVEKRYADALEAITLRAPEARVLVIGYPRLLPDSGDCPDRVRFARGDLDFVRSSFDALDAMIKRVAGRLDLEFVDVNSASRGHDICSDDPWINGRRKDPRTKAAPYHPMPAEQEAVAGLVLARLGSD